MMQGSGNPRALDVAGPEAAPSGACGVKVLGNGWAGPVRTACLLRVGLVLWAWWAAGNTGPFFHFDTESYLAPARSLAERGAFEAGGQVELLRTPGYPWLLAVGVAVGYPVVVTLVLQVGLSLLTVVLVGRLAELWFGEVRAGRVAAWLAAIEPLGCTYASLLLSETLFTTLLVTGLYLLLRAQASGSLWRFALCGGWLAAAAYVRPIGYPLPGVLAGGIVLGGWWRGDGWRAMRQASVLLAVAYALTGAWQMRNAQRADYAKFSAIDDVNLYSYLAAAVEAQRTGRPYYEIQDERGYHDFQQYLRLHPEQREWTSGQRYRWQRRAAWGTLRHDPGIALAIHAKGMLRTLIDPGSVDLARLLSQYPAQGGLLGAAVDRGVAAAVARLFRERSVLAVASLGMAVLLAGYYLLALRGWVHVGLGKTWVWPAVFTVGYLVVASGGPQSVARFRHPVMPLLAALAGGGYVALCRRRDAA